MQLKLTQALVKCRSITPNDDGALLIVQDHLSSNRFYLSPLLFFRKMALMKLKILCNYWFSRASFALLVIQMLYLQEMKIHGSIPFFQQSIENDKLYGRGTEDMKSNIACFVSATDKFLKKIW